MRKTLKFTPVILAFFVLFLTAGCNKDKDDGMIDVQFKISNANDDGGISMNATNQKSGNLKSIPIEEIPCSSYRVTYVKAVIDGVTKKVTTFYNMENGLEMLYTNTFPLVPGDHVISDFSLWYDNGTPTNESDDILLSATPHENSLFAEYVGAGYTVDHQFSVVVDEKAFIDMKVVCYNEEQAVNFGFSYFGISQTKVYDLNFFGDFCVKNKKDYNGSLYSEQNNWNSVSGNYYDGPAIAKIQLWQKKDAGPWTFIKEESNSSQGETIGIQYGDEPNVLDSIELRLFIYVKTGTTYSYEWFYTWKLKEGEFPLQTVDPNPPYGKTTFYSLGSCGAGWSNYEFPGWQTLPPTCTYTIVGNYAPGSLGGYVDAQLSNIDDGYEIGNGVYDSYCADHNTTINVGTPYNMDIYSSQYIDELPAFARTSQWPKINWLINNVGFPGTGDLYPGHIWADLQEAFWLLEPTPWNGIATGGVPDASSIARQMAADANANYSGYQIPVGGWAAVIYIPHGTPGDATTPSIQTMFTKVDP